MGVYHGGGNIITRGQFGSFDPAEESSLSRSKKKQSAPSKKLKSSKPKNNIKVNPEKLTNLVSKTDKIRIRLIHFVIDQMILKRGKFDLPKNTAPELNAEVYSCGGPIMWAKKQSEFRDLKSKKINKKKKPNKKKYTSPPVSEIMQKIRQRKALMDSLVDQMISSDLPLTIGKPEKFLFDEIRAAGSALKWITAQPGYNSLFHRRFLKQNLTKETTKSKKLKLPKENKSKPTKESLIARGKKRTYVFSTDISDDQLAVYFEKIGVLPLPPKYKIGSGKNMKKRKSEARKSWLNKMNKIQKFAWEGLSPRDKDEYFATGRISIGKRPKVKKYTSQVAPLVNAPKGQIIKNIFKDKEDEWDYRKIDWDLT